MNIYEAFVRPEYFGKDFRDPSWDHWKIVLKAVCGLELTEDEHSFFRSLAQRDPLPEGHNEVYCIAGRRSGKTRVASALLCAHALLGNHNERLAPGERAFGFIISVDRAQSQVAMGYCKAFLERFPDMVERVTSDQIDLSNGCSICVKTSSFKSSRGFATFGIVLDEISFFPQDESAAPAEALIDALLPSLLEQGIIWGCSSPYSKSGYLWDIYHEHFGDKHNDDPIMVIQAPTTSLHPTFSESLLKRLFSRKKKMADVEISAQFRDDIEPYISEALVERRTLLPEQSGYDPQFTYTAFLDASTGGGQDSFTLGIAHAEEKLGVCIDRLEEFTPPFSPEEVVLTYSGIIKRYNVRTVYADRFGGELIWEKFRFAGIHIEPSPETASALFQEFAIMLRSDMASLPKHEKLQRQLMGLERKTQHASKDRIEAGPGGHDDVANAAAGAAVMCRRRYRKYTEKEMDAMLPQTTGHLSPRDTLIAEEQRKADLNRSNSEIMGKYMHDSGCTPASVPQRPRRPWDNR